MGTINAADQDLVMKGSDDDGDKINVENVCKGYLRNDQDIFKQYGYPSTWSDRRKSTCSLQ